MQRPGPAIPAQATVRPAAQADMGAVTDIYAHWVRHGTASFETEPPDRAEMEARWRTLMEGGYPYLAAERDGKVVGYAYAGPYRARRAYRDTLENAVYVAPRTQRAGIGRLLLAALIADAEAHGFRQMIAVIGDSSNSASIRLHRALGFHFAGTLHSVGHKHGRWLDTVIMQRALGPGDGRPPSL